LRRRRPSFALICPSFACWPQRTRQSRRTRMDEDRTSQSPGVTPVTIRADVGVEAIGAAEWNALAGGSPLASHAFLSALHETGCASGASGWTPCYLTAWRGGKLAGAVPLYG